MSQVLPRRGIATLLVRWAGDLAMGVRVALGGDRSAWTRLALTAVGVGLGVMVLLAASSVSTMFQARTDRADARGGTISPIALSAQQPIPGVDPVDVTTRASGFEGNAVRGYLVEPTGPHAPRPPGVDRLPSAGEVVLSPALAELLRSREGKSLRPLFPQRVIGTITPEGLLGPHELYFYTGVANLAEQRDVQRIYRFDVPERPSSLNGLEWLLVMLGTATFLVPVVVFVSAGSRLAAAARDRRLAALRLLGADGRQVRRIAAGESFVGSLAGLVVGAVMFSIVRQVLPHLSLTALGGGIFTEDVSPEWTLVVLVVLLVPALAVTVAVLSLRRTIIEPLGVVRRAGHTRRRLWWRLLPAAGGSLLLLAQARALSHGTVEANRLPIAVGIVALLITVPVILPWIVERAVRLPSGGSPAWQLAVRRLQLDSGTAARVVGGVAVVLAGAISLQTLFIPARGEATTQSGKPVSAEATLATTSLTEADRFTQILRGMPGADIQRLRIRSTLRAPGTSAYLPMAVGSCSELAAMAKIGDCVDGDVFYVKPERNNEWTLRPTAGRTLWAVGDRTRTLPDSASWTVPVNLRQVQAQPGMDSSGGLVLLTRGALGHRSGMQLSAQATLKTATDDPLFVEHVGTALAPLGWNVEVLGPNYRVSGTYYMIARALNIGSVITLLLAAASLLVVALEQIRERRRALAVLMASGVQTTVLARSLLWQTAIPILLGIVTALSVGIGLAMLLLDVAGRPVAIDWSMIALYCTGGAVAVFAVTVLTLPALRTAGSVEGLRAE